MSKIYAVKLYTGIGKMANIFSDRAEAEKALILKMRNAALGLEGKQSIYYFVEKYLGVGEREEKFHANFEILEENEYFMKVLYWIERGSSTRISTVEILSKGLNGSFQTTKKIKKEVKCTLCDKKIKSYHDHVSPMPGGLAISYLCDDCFKLIQTCRFMDFTNMSLVDNMRIQISEA